MPDERIIQQVSGILGMNNIPFRTDESQSSFLVPSGSAGVFISFVDFGESTLVALRSVVLEQVDGSGERKLKTLEALNEKNRTVPFGCFYFDPDAGFVVYDYHLLGDQLQAEELMNALTAIAMTADRVDDEIRDAIGSGVRATDVWNAAQGNSSEPESVGPVVET
jgi:T3SS (YopN, CesT) and YbjN peptide-binding chaperone 1